MAMPPSFKEEYISQIPALQLLKQLGFTYLPPAATVKLRGDKLRNVVLTDVLRDWLTTNNEITFKGQRHTFTAANIDLAIQQLLDEPFDGLIRTNEKLYERLTLGISLKQTIDGDSKSHSLHYIDWQHPERNVYHVTDEFVVERTRSLQTRRPDIVCFVNGIPLVVIECKRPDKSSEGESSVFEGVSQMIRNQRPEEIPQLFVFSQLLLAINTNDARYATTGTPRKFWGIWQEEDAAKLEAPLHQAINTPLTDVEKVQLYDHRDNGHLVRRYFDDLAAAGERWVTVQDQALYHLLRPARLLELVYQFLLFDGGIKKIARYQQYFAVKATIDRVARLNPDGKRTGGIIWHTTGSGKSLTMVMLAKALSLHLAISNPKVILVTDRVDLDVQLYNTFRACGKNVVQAQSGRHLVELVQQPGADIIATVIDKFETVAKEKVSDPNPNIFVLIDESHRSQYGTTHAKMRLVFPNACYLGATGTPLLKKEKSTAAKFGDFIHKYPMRQAVADQAVVPLIYEGRLVELEPDQASIDRWFERVTKELSEEQKRDLKHKFSRQGEVSKAEQRIQQIAYDIMEHYVANHQHSGRKAQLAVPSKLMALRYKEYLDEFGEIASAVVISPPDTREGNEQVDETDLPKVQAFWKRTMEQYGSEEAYNREIVASFGRADGVELLIVVDKLLTGFDEPRNAVLYIDKPLKEHGLLQAIARVNRLPDDEDCEKEYGYIVDYRGVLGKLNEAINVYDALADFDTEDVTGTLIDIEAMIDELPQAHANLWAVFRPVANKRDTEQLERYLEPEDIRDQFYTALTAFAKTFQVALSAATFYEEVPESQIALYKRDLTFFHNLRNSVRQRYAETIAYSAYEQKIRKLMDRHITASYVTTITAAVNIFDVDAFAAEVGKLDGAAARADTIAHQMKRVITERMEQDPAYYKSFADLIDETIADYKQGRIDEAHYLEKMRQQHQRFVSGQRDSTPSKLRQHKHAAAYYGMIQAPILAHVGEGMDADELSADMAIRIEEIIEDRKIRDWTNNPDVQSAMENDIEDYLFSIKGRYDLPLTLDEIDHILEQVIHIAKQRNHL